MTLTPLPTVSWTGCQETPTEVTPRVGAAVGVTKARSSVGTPLASSSSEVPSGTAAAVVEASPLIGL